MILKGNPGSSLGLSLKKGNKTTQDCLHKKSCYDKVQMALVKKKAKC